MNKYEHYIIVGTGKFAYTCAKILMNVTNKEVLVYEYMPSSYSGLFQLCVRGGLAYKQFLDAELLKKELLSITGQTLVISAFNTYIFPKIITENSRFEIINYHPAVLPQHPGRNAEAWAIYENDDYSGITWHYVTKQIDCGKVLVQEQIELDPSMTSIQLMILQQNIAIKCFEKMIVDVILQKQKIVEINGQLGKMHMSYEVPNDGILDLHWSGIKIASFVRCMDYGRLEILGKPLISLGEKYYTWKSYEIITDDIRMNEEIRANDYVINKNKMRILLRELSEVEKEI